MKSSENEKFRLYISHQPCQPHEAIYIGDAPNDIVSAREVSMPVIAATWADTANAAELETYEPDKICYSIAELYDYLMKII